MHAQRTWIPAPSERLELGQVRWIRVEGDVPAGLCLIDRDSEREYKLTPGRTVDFGQVHEAHLVAPALMPTANMLEVWSGALPIGATNLAEQGGRGRPYLEHLRHLTRSIAAGASFPMFTRTWVPFTATAGTGLAHPFETLLVLSSGDRAHELDAVDPFDGGASSVLLATAAATARPGGLFTARLVLERAHPRVQIDARNTSANTLQVTMHTYGIR